MTERMIDFRIKKIAKLEEAKAALEKEISELKEEVMAEMGDLEVLETPHVKVSWKVILSNRFDSKAFKAEHSALYAEYLKEIRSRRFTYSIR